MFNFSSFCLPSLLARILLATLFFVFHLSATAQVLGWQSARAVAVASVAGSGNNSIVTATAVDASGNVYLTGTFINSVVLGGTTLTSSGDRDVFVAKFNPANNQFAWAQRAGGTGFDQATAIVISGTSVYVAGYFDGPNAGFGPTTLTNSSNTGFNDLFVAKLTDVGIFVWAQRAGGQNTDQAFALAVNGTSVYVAGTFASTTVSFGPTTLINTGGSDVYVAKLTDAGSTAGFSWAQQAGGTSYDNATSLAVSGTSVYVTGHFSSSTADFGTTVLTSAGSFDVFVAKLTDAGSRGAFVWAQRAGGSGYDYASALALNGTNIYVAGEYINSTASFGATTLANVGGFDVFVTKLTDAGSTGSFVWAQQAGGTNNDVTTALAVNGRSVYVAGYFGQCTANFGTTILTSVGTSDAFVAKLTEVGSTSSFAWAQRAGSLAQASANALSISGSSVYVAGYFMGPSADFGTTILNNPSSTSLGFLASLTDPTLTATAASRALAPAQLYPNPAHHTATLRLLASTTPAPLTLSDALGQTVRRYPAPAGPEAALDVRGLPAGLYLLRGAGPALRLAVE